MATTRLLTAEEFFDMEDDGTFSELVRGELVRMPPPGAEHGWLALEIGWHLRNYLREHPIGTLYTQSGFILARNPDVVRAPDIAFVRAGRLPTTHGEGYPELAPDLVVEVISPTDRAGQIAEKLEDYVTAGVRRVWFVNPRVRAVTVHYPDRTSRTLRIGQELDGEEVLPGFRLPLAELFAETER